jgi:hypothetical protein
MPRVLSEIYLEDATIDGVPYPSQGGHPISLTYLNGALSPFSPLLSGWAPAIETWEYASSTSFSISGDKRDKYQKGDKIRLKQGGDWKYFYITGVSYSAPNTTITITGGSDYTLANAAITDNYYSKAMNPQGWPVSLGQRVGDKEIWHEGNDGSGSGLDADTVDGYHITGVDRNAMRGLAMYESGAGIDANTTTYHCFLTHRNTPGNKYGFVIQIFYSTISATSNRCQLCLDYNGNLNGHAYTRYYTGGAWSEWRDLG